MSEHTPKHLYLRGHLRKYISSSPHGLEANSLIIADDVHHKIGERLVAAYNACAGIPTEQLKAGSVARMLQAARHVLDPDEDLLIALAPFRKD